VTETELEQRLRGALAARAAQITQDNLGFGVPPTATARKPRSRRWWWWLAAPAAAAVVLGFAGLVSGPREPAPVLPGQPPAVTEPTPSPSYTPIPVTPAPSEPESPSSPGKSPIGSPEPTSTESRGTSKAPSGSAAVSETPSAAVTPGR
jgi:hypothetical protein